MTALILLGAIIIVVLIFHRPLTRIFRLITFGLSIFTNGQSLIINLLTRSVKIIDSTYDDGRQDLPLRIFRSAAKREESPAVILYHGASPKGIEHPAMNLLARNLVQLGFTVYFPRLPQLNNMKFSPETYPRMKRIFHQISTLPEVDAHRIIVAGMSFAGGMAVKLATEKNIRPAGVISFGSYFDLEATTEFFFTGRDNFGDTNVDITPHEYTKAVWFWNYLDHLELPFDLQPVRRAIGHFIRDERQRLEESYLACSPDQRSFLKKIFDPREPYAIEYFHSLRPIIESLSQQLSPRYFYQDVQVPIFIIHGVRDNMIPYTQSLALTEALETSGLEHYPFLMRLYAHSESEKSSPAEFINEVKALYRLLKNLLLLIDRNEH